MHSITTKSYIEKNKQHNQSITSDIKLSSQAPEQCHTSPASPPPATQTQNSETNHKKINPRKHKSFRAYKDGREGEVRSELRNAETTLSGASEVVGEGEGGEHDLNGEVEKINDLLAMALREGLPVEVGTQL